MFCYLYRRILSTFELIECLLKLDWSVSLGFYVKLQLMILIMPLSCLLLYCLFFTANEWFEKFGLVFSKETAHWLQSRVLPNVALLRTYIQHGTCRLTPLDAVGPARTLFWSLGGGGGCISALGSGALSGPTGKEVLVSIQLFFFNPGEALTPKCFSSQ